MPRPQKSGLDYFPLDVNIFSDNKIRILKARYGMNGVSVYIYLLCEIYKNGYYMEWNDDFKYILADELNLTDGFIEQVLTFLLERSLLSSTLFKSDTILTSPGIQRRYQLAVKERAKKTPIKIKGFWLLDEAETEPFIKVNPNEDKSQKNEDKSWKNEDKSREESLKERKGKKRKEKENKNKEETGRGNPVQHISNERLKQALLDYIEYKRQKKCPLTEIEIRSLIEYLAGMGNEEEQILILKQSINKGWKNIYPLEEKGQRKSNQKPNRFHNFEQRETNYDAMVMERLQERLKEQGVNDDGGNKTE